MVKRMRKRVEVIDLTPSTGAVDDAVGQDLQGDLFRCEVANVPLKDDMASMEVPIFSLSKTPDYEIREYRNGPRYVRITPSASGAATMHDKDLLLYAVSHITAQLNLNAQRGEADKPVSGRVRIMSSDFLRDTERGDGGGSYERILEMLRRLKGTQLETNIPTNGVVRTEGFSLIDAFSVISEKKSTVLRKDKDSAEKVPVEVTRVLEFTVTLSEWMLNGVKAFQVKTLDKVYYQITSSLERRLYEIAAKHCGDQAMWYIDIDKLMAKVGTRMQRFKFREELRASIEGDRMPEYRVALDASAKPDDVVFYTRDSNKLSAHLIKLRKEGVAGITWFGTLDRADNVSTWRKKRDKTDTQQARGADAAANT